ncbi:MAG: rod shape-determining protein MreC [Nitrospiraceae bacterium]
MTIARLTYGSRRFILALVALFLLLLLLLPAQTQGLLLQFGGPVGRVLAWPIEAFSGISSATRELWDGYIALQTVHEDNRRLVRDVELLREENNRLRESAQLAQRLAGMLQFQERQPFQTVAARVIGKDATNWYQAILIDKGESDGVESEMGVVTPVGVVGRVVKTTHTTAVVLLLTDPNNAIAGLLQRTRDEGIVEGTAQRGVRMKYLPLLAGMQDGDWIVTSGLVGGFPRGIPIGTLTKIEKDEGELFQVAVVEPAVNFSKLEEVLVITKSADAPAADTFQLAPKKTPKAP